MSKIKEPVSKLSTKDQELVKTIEGTPLPKPPIIGPQKNNVALPAVDLEATKPEDSATKKLPLTDTVKEPVNVEKAVQSGGVTVQQPQESKPTQAQPTPGLTYSTPAPKPVTITQAQPVNISKAVQSGGLTMAPAPAPKPAPAPQPKAPSLATIITGAAGQAVNKLKSWFGW